MRIVATEAEKDYSEKVQAELLARIEMEVRYLLRPATTKLFLRRLYQEENGKPPAQRRNLLNWFFANHRYDLKLNSWEQQKQLLH